MRVVQRLVFNPPWLWSVLRTVFFLFLLLLFFYFF
jgi:hypothetical protein